MTSTRRSGGNTASMRIRSALGLAGVTLALGTTPAVAQDPGVFIDPGSPSAKEYALPFESERRQADPGTPQGAAIPQGQRVSPAFGEGIEPTGASGGQANAGTSGGSSTAGGTGSAESPRSGGGSGNGATSADGGAAQATIRAATANPGAPGGDAGSTFAIAGVALLVLLAGLAAGFVLRRRRT